MGTSQKDFPVAWLCWTCSQWIMFSLVCEQLPVVYSGLALGLSQASTEGRGWAHTWSGCSQVKGQDMGGGALLGLVVFVFFNNSFVLSSMLFESLGRVSP